MRGPREWWRRKVQEADEEWREPESYEEAVARLGLSLVRIVLGLIGTGVAVAAIVALIREPDSTEGDRLMLLAVCLYGIDWGLGELYKRLR